MAQLLGLHAGHGEVKEEDGAVVARPIGRVDDLAEDDAVAVQRREPQLGLRGRALEHDRRLPVGSPGDQQLRDRTVRSAIERRPHDRLLLDAEAGHESRTSSSPGWLSSRIASSAWRGMSQRFQARSPSIGISAKATIPRSPAIFTIE